MSRVIRQPGVVVLCGLFLLGVGQASEAAGPQLDPGSGLIIDISIIQMITSFYSPR